jgi:hypothetical protein
VQAPPTSWTKYKMHAQPAPPLQVAHTHTHTHTHTHALAGLQEDEVTRSACTVRRAMGLTPAPEPAAVVTTPKGDRCAPALLAAPGLVDDGDRREPLGLVSPGPAAALGLASLRAGLTPSKMLAPEVLKPSSGIGAATAARSECWPLLDNIASRPLRGLPSGCRPGRLSTPPLKLSWCP